MAKKAGMKDKLFRATYDKPTVNKTLLNVKKSLDEVKSLINTNNKK